MNPNSSIQNFGRANNKKINYLSYSQLFICLFFFFASTSSFIKTFSSTYWWSAPNHFWFGTVQLKSMLAQMLQKFNVFYLFTSLKIKNKLYLLKKKCALIYYHMYLDRQMFNGLLSLCSWWEFSFLQSFPKVIISVSHNTKQQLTNVHMVRQSCSG